MNGALFSSRNCAVHESLPGTSCRVEALDPAKLTSPAALLCSTRDRTDRTIEKTARNQKLHNPIIT
jgi:hypothetical protein